MLTGCPPVTETDDPIDTSDVSACAGAGELIFYGDADGDGFGLATEYQFACEAPEGTAERAGDCDDTDPSIFPAAEEVCNGIDDNCDSAVDNGDDLSTFYGDTDGDGFGSVSDWVRACSAPTGYVSAATDCDDSDAAISPDADELCNGIDDNCDDGVDNDAVDADTWYADFDNDGFGTIRTSLTECEKLLGYVDNDLDCNDATALVAPGLPELCDSLDNDCDGSVDEGAIDQPTWYTDGDGDGFGDPATEELGCKQRTGFVAEGGDCNDDDDTIFPGAVEVCGDGVDSDCSDKDVDGDEDGIGKCDDCDDHDASIGLGEHWYTDGDLDGFGDEATAVQACVQPADTLALGGDCDDDNVDVHPGAVELCSDIIDRDCDGTNPDGDGDGLGHCDDCDDSDASITVPTTWFEDTDGDGFGIRGSTIDACELPEDYSASNDDCDDEDPNSFPGGSETCDGADNDCNELVDDDPSDGTTYFTDADLDGFGVATPTRKACSLEAGWSLNATDCDDTEATIKPGGTETDNDTDDDCDGHIDEDFFTYVHSRDIQPIWDSNCNGCHGSSGGLTIALTDGYLNIVNVPSTQVTGLMRIAPGDPDVSYIWHKLQGMQGTVGGFGNSMPPGSPLNASELSIIETWILEGAPP